MARVTVDEGIGVWTPLTDMPDDKTRREVLFIFRPYWHDKFESDCRLLLKRIEEARQLGWIGFGDEETFIRDGLRFSVDLVDHVRRGLALVGDGEPVTMSAALKAAATMAGAPDTVGPGQGARTDLQPRDDVTKSDRGNSAPYLAARLKRDHPEIAAAVERGEYRSIRAAAIDAGIVKKRTPLDQLLSAWKRASEDERRAFLDAIDTPVFDRTMAGAA